VHRALPLVPVAVLLASCGNDITVGQTVNLDPTAFIDAPAPGPDYSDAEGIEFRGVVGDSNGLDDISTVTWTSSIDGELGTPEDVAPDQDGRTEFSWLLSAGTHVITLTAVDQGGLQASDSITLDVEAEQQVPQVAISVPDEFTEVFEQDRVTLVGLVSDLQQPATSLSVRWYATENASGDEYAIDGGVPNGDGVSSAAFVPELAGRYVLTLEAIDEDGNVGEDSRIVIVKDPDDEDWDGDGYSVNRGDCDDEDDTAFPGNVETCDGVDNDCNGVVDDKDIDRDGVMDAACGEFYDGAALADDCDDAEANVHPGLAETCDGLDNDCTGFVDDKDADGDMHVDLACTDHDGPLPADDCDDDEPLAHPAQAELCDLIDNDCNEPWTTRTWTVTCTWTSAAPPTGAACRSTTATTPTATATPTWSRCWTAWTTTATSTWTRAPAPSTTTATASARAAPAPAPSTAPASRSTRATATTATATTTPTPPTTRTPTTPTSTATASMVTWTTPCSWTRPRARTATAA